MVGFGGLGVGWLILLIFEEWWGQSVPTATFDVIFYILPTAFNIFRFLL